MRIFRRNRDDGHAAATALADRGSGIVVDPELTDEEIPAEIDRLTAANLTDRSQSNELQLLALRHLAGLRLVEATSEEPGHPEPDFARLPDDGALPEIAASELTPELLRAGSCVTAACWCAGWSIAAGRWTSPPRSTLPSTSGLAGRPAR